MLSSRIVTVPCDIPRWAAAHAAFRETGIPFTAVESVRLDDPEINIMKRVAGTKRKEASLLLFFIRQVMGARDRNDPYIILFEDDARPVYKDVYRRMERIIDSLPGDFGICYLGAYIRPNCRGSLTRLNADISEFHGEGPSSNIIWGTHALLIGKKAYGRIIDGKAGTQTLVSDSYMSGSVVPFVRTFFAVPQLFIQDHAGPGMNTSSGPMHGAFDFVKLEKESREWINRHTVISHTGI